MTTSSTTNPGATRNVADLDPSSPEWQARWAAAWRNRDPMTCAAPPAPTLLHVKLREAEALAWDACEKARIRLNEAVQLWAEAETAWWTARTNPTRDPQD